MAEKKRILLQLDTDPRPSVFDAVVAVDAGAEILLPHGGIRPEAVRDLVYGSMFTRSPSSLKSTAIFVGGSDVALGEEVVRAVRGTFFGPLRVSVLLDSAGANTTAAAAVIAAGRSLRARGESLAGRCAVVLGATGPVGRRVVQLLARAGATVRVASRDGGRAAEVADLVRGRIEGASLEPVAVRGDADLDPVLDGAEVVVASGPPQVCLLPASARARAGSLRVAIDLNAVPPTGIEGIDPSARGTRDGDTDLWGALGVGDIKMKIHRRAIARLFESSDAILDAEEVFSLGETLD